MNQRFEVGSIEELTPVAEAIIAHASDYPIILFRGEMGSGKTTLISRIMLLLGVKETSSPTFSLVNLYDTAEGPWYHFDLYRIEEAEELYDIGFEEYLQSGSPCMIEWPQIASEYIEAPYLIIDIQLIDTQRVITLSERDR